MADFTANYAINGGPTLSASFAVSQPTAPTTPGLPFYLDTAALRKSPKKYFAHYFGPFPISIDNAAPDTDYYGRNYIPARGEGGAHAAQGGYIRNRPKGRNPIAGDYVTADAKTDIAQAVGGGLDGFFCDIMSASGKNWTFYMSAIAAANQMFPNGEFKIVPMIDTNGGGVGTATADQLADALHDFWGSATTPYPSTWRLDDGRMVVSSFYAEKMDVSWWDAIFTSLKNRYNIQAAFLPAYLNIGQSPNFTGKPWTYGSGFWGDGADPQIQRMAANHGTDVHARGEKYLFPIQGQSVRIYSNKFDEAHGTQALREAWNRAISDSADYVQLVTWNDYSEGGEFNDSMAHGLVQLDISAYYATKWKTGNFPQITKDVVYLSHRDQPSTATPTGGQTQRAVQWSGGRANREAVQNVVEVLTFLTAPATVTVVIGDSAQNYTAPAGVNAQYFPLKTGSAPTVSVVRNGSTVASVASVSKVTMTPLKDDPGYYQVGSERGTAGQANIQDKYSY
jgi:hypothetical protein